MDQLVNMKKNFDILRLQNLLVTTLSSHPWASKINVLCYFSPLLQYQQRSLYALVCHLHLKQVLLYQVI